MGEGSGRKHESSDGLAQGDHGLGLIEELVGASAMGALNPFSPVEARLAKLATDLYMGMLVQARMNMRTMEVGPLTSESVVAAAKLSIQAAITMDDDLRKVRKKLEEER